MSAEIKRRRRQAKILRVSRSVHRTTGALLFAFFFVLAATGLLLGWKKNTGGIILADSHEGSSTDLKDWLPLDVLHRKAIGVMRASVSPDLSLELDRIDVRPDKGMVKFVFVEHYWGVQLDGATGEVLHVERRRADFVENVHDGSVLDYLAGTGGQIKLAYTSIMGIALLTFTATGFWLWYGPKRFRAKSKYHRYKV
jgi:uncharacterized iron-regulated membrane protein